MATTDREQEAPFAHLATRLRGELLRPQNPAFEATRQLWNGRVTTQPAALVRCRSVQDVIETVLWAQAYDFPLSVRGGGHDWAGRALCDHGVVVDCSLLRAVSIDPVTRTARVEGGATAGDLIGTAQPYGLATTTGTNSTVGMAGFTLGGGYGALMGAYGLGADNLLAAQVVTADGHLTRWLRDMRDEVVDTLIEDGLPVTSPFSILALHNFHGAASRVGASDTAFALRQDHLMVEMIAGWDRQTLADEQRHIRWAQHISHALAPHALTGGYINLLDAAEQERIPAAFGSNYQRLLDLKRRYDPHDVFRSTIGHLTV